MNEVQKMKAPEWGEVDVLGATYEEGKPSGENMGKWSQKLSSRDETIKYLKTGQRYFYSDESFGSEKRKTPA